MSSANTRAGLVGLFAFAGIMTAMSVSSANAALFIDGGTGGSIPLTGTNDVAINVAGLGGEPVDGFFGASVGRTGTSDLVYAYLGFEAGFKNQFLVDDSVVFDNKVLAGGAGSQFATSVTSPIATFVSSSSG
jgi:hypothetical protein